MRGTSSAAVHRRAGKLEAAEAALRQAIQRDAKAAAYHNELGNLLQDRGRLNDAIAAYRRALRLYPGFAEAWNDLGTARYAKGEFEAAVDCYQHALRLRPDHVVAYANLGAVYRKLGLLSEARRALQSELWQRLRQGARSLWRREPTLSRASPRRNYAWETRATRRRSPSARSKLDARNVAALKVLGEALLRQGRAEEALTAARRAADAQPADARAAAPARSRAGRARAPRRGGGRLPRSARAAGTGATAPQARRAGGCRAAAAPGARAAAAGRERSTPALGEACQRQQRFDGSRSALPARARARCARISPPRCA